MAITINGNGTSLVIVRVMGDVSEVYENGKLVRTREGGWVDIPLIMKSNADNCDGLLAAARVEAPEFINRFFQQHRSVGLDQEFVEQVHETFGVSVAVEYREYEQARVMLAYAINPALGGVAYGMYACVVELDG